LNSWNLLHHKLLAKVGEKSDTVYLTVIVQSITKITPIQVVQPKDIVKKNKRKRTRIDSECLFLVNGIYIYISADTLEDDRKTTCAKWMEQGRTDIGRDAFPALRNEEE